MLTLKNNKSILGFNVIFVSLLAGCGGNKVDDLQPTTESIQRNIFDRACLNCHGHKNPIHGIDLSEGFAVDTMFYQISFMEAPLNLIEAGDPDNSLLIQKMYGTAVTEAMPMFAPLLPKEQVDVMAEWVANMEPVPQPSLIYLQKNLFDVSCATAGCHDSETKAEKIKLE